MPEPEQRVRLAIQGVVQGVGFRPFVFDLAATLALAGHVANTSEGVLVEVQGSSLAVETFLRELPLRAPPLAFIVEMTVDFLDPIPSPAPMHIRPSEGAIQRSVLIAPDVSLCNDCLRELRDPTDRRYRYPFINCTNCGPRFTIIDDVPYDRALTSMARFPMCAACQAEYNDPRNRRFHAQPNACAICGPHATLHASNGALIATTDPLQQAAILLSNGALVGLKGLGGFHLAVNAYDNDAVVRLRHRKHREGRPLAVMCRDLNEVRRIAEPSAHELELLMSRQRPIVLLPKREPFPLASSVAPGNTHVGVMLPYTPLHALLLDHAPASLVMTSGNVSEEPIVFGNEEAVERLGGIADALVLHDRDILVRNDDSVVMSARGRTAFLRRSRGYVPLPVMLGREVPCVLAVGADLKNTICLTRGRMAFLSQHLGDQSNLAAYASFLDAIGRMKRILGAEPVAVAADLHPDSMPSQWADQAGLPLLRVQHHHAHVASCLAEHQREEDVIGIALDGVGLGTDGTLWGGEILVASVRDFRRVGHLGCVRMPGGDQAAREPWRMAVSHLMHAYGDAWESRMPPALRSIPADRRLAVAQLVATGTASPWTSSTGRLFDAVASLCGLFQESTFEAQAAMGLELAAACSSQEPSEGYEWNPERHDGQIILEPASIVRQVVDDLAMGQQAPSIARRFHQGLANGLARACELVREDTQLGTVALSGGSLQNRLLAGSLRDGLERRGFAVLEQEKVPPNDGGLALGQAIVAAYGVRGGGFRE